MRKAICNCDDNQDTEQMLTKKLTPADIQDFLKRVSAAIELDQANVDVMTIDLSLAKAALWLSLTAFLALVVLYFVGLDQGATSVFGDNMYVHEFVHDARHLLGFPCH